MVEASVQSETPKPHGALATVALAYLLTLVGSVAGYAAWQLFYREPSVPNLSDVWGCLCLPIVAVPFGPLSISLWIGLLLMGPGAGVLGAVVLLLGVVLQCALLVRAVRRLFWTKDSWQRWAWRVFLFAYSALAMYVMSVVGSAT